MKHHIIERRVWSLKLAFLPSFLIPASNHVLDESTSSKSHGRVGSDTTVVRFILICLPRTLIYRNIKMRHHQALVFLLTEKGFVFVLFPKSKVDLH